MSDPKTTTEMADPSRDRQTLDSIQALRGIAASLVLFYHLAAAEKQFGTSHVLFLQPFLYLGAQGVDLFFVISGFIIFWTNSDSFGRPEKIPKYLARRVLRIFPLYWIFFAFAYAMGRFGFSHALDAASDPLNLIGIFFLLPIECVHIVPVSWTLTFEFFFYCLFAVMLLFERRRFPVLLLAWFSLVVLATVFRPAASESASIGSRIAHVVVGLRTIQFMFGCAIALLLKRGTLSRPALWCALGVLVYAASGARVAVLESQAHLDDLWRPELIVTFGIGSAGMVAGAVALERRQGGGFVPRWLVALGDASYSLYLSHLFVFAVLRRLLQPLNRPTIFAHFLWLAALCACGLVGGLLSYRFIERPIMRTLGAATNRYFAKYSRPNLLG